MRFPWTSEAKSLNKKAFQSNVNRLPFRQYELRSEEVWTGHGGGAVQLNKFEYVQGDRTLYIEVQVEQVQTCRGRQTDTTER